MEGLIQLLVLAAIMSISTFLIGSLPLILSSSFSPRRSHQLSIFSVGLLIGAALTIVIPEGVDTIYASADSSSHSNGTSSSPPSQVPSIQDLAHNNHHSTIGLTLLSGFMLMFLIDQLNQFIMREKHEEPVVRTSKSRGKLCSSQTEALLPDRSHDDGLEASLEDLEDPISSNPPKVLPLAPQDVRSHTKSHSFSTIIGLLTHSVADGIALGASSTHTAHLESTNSGKKITLNLIIFIALMVHKAPAAFGFVSVLMSSGLSKSFVSKALLTFSLAAPLGSLLTWTTLALIHQIRFGNNPNDPDSSSDQEGIQWFIGVTLLFSGGTFLFVATHALESIASRPVDLCFPQILPPIDPPQSSTCASSYDQGLQSNRQGIPHELIRQIKSDSTNKSNLGPLLTSALMVSGMLFPWILTQVIGAHH